MSTANNPAYPRSHYTQPDGDVRWGEDGFTQRERACIDLRVADSGQEWLDVLIRKARKMDTATAVAAGLLANPDTVPSKLNGLEAAMEAADNGTNLAILIAFSLLKASEQ